MVDTVNVAWIHPPLAMDTAYAAANFHPNQRRIILQLLNRSDGTGESAVVKVDKSALYGPDTAVPGSLVVEEIEWQVNGFNYVTLLFDQTTDQVISVLKGNGYKDFRPGGGLIDQGSGGAGDILLTTNGGAAGSSYSITLNIRLKA